MKVVINRCFGGFSLSDAAIVYYAQKKGLTLYPFHELHYGEGYIQGFSVNNWGSFYSTKPLLQKENGMVDYDDDSFFSDREIERTDSALVQTVEDLGRAANGMCAELAVVEIPDGTDYEIEEYDGRETIAERHAKWY